MVNTWKIESKKEKLRREIERLKEKEKQAMIETGGQNPTSVRGRAGVAGVGSRLDSNGNLDVEKANKYTLRDVNGLQDLYGSV